MGEGGRGGGLHLKICIVVTRCNDTIGSCGAIVQAKGQDFSLIFAVRYVWLLHVDSVCKNFASLITLV